MSYEKVTHCTIEINASSLYEKYFCPTFWMRPYGFTSFCLLSAITGCVNVALTNDDVKQLLLAGVTIFKRCFMSYEKITRRTVLSNTICLYEKYCCPTFWMWPYSFIPFCLLSAITKVKPTNDNIKQWFLAGVLRVLQFLKGVLCHMKKSRTEQNK